MVKTQNITLKSLILSNIFNTPIFTTSHTTQKSNFYATKFRLNNIFTNFYFSKAKIASLHIDKSIFTCFTESVIHISKEDIKQTEFQRTFVNSNESDVYTIKQCVFQKTRSSSSGGALLISSEKGNLTISETGFTICLATDNGGGIEFEGIELTMNKCCFLGCLAVRFGQAFDISGDNSLQGNIGFNSIQQCATARSPGLSQSLFIRHGIHNLYALNSSFNHVTDVGSCLTVAHTSRFSLQYSNFFNNHGDNTFWLHMIKPDDELTACNIVGNVVKKNLGLFTFENSSAKFSNFIFLENKCPVYFISGILFLNRCYLDTKRNTKLVKDCNLSFAESAFGIKSLRTRPLPTFITWECWGLGAPSATPSPSLPPVEHALEEAVLGVWVLGAILGIGLVTSYIGYTLMSKAKDINSIQSEKMDNIEMGN